MAVHYVQTREASIALACQAFTISQSCYRYKAKNVAGNELIANSLIRLTDKHRN
jgi:putative transposase